MFAFVWAALLPLCLISAFVGVLLWVWVALLSPNDLLTGFMEGVPFNKIVAIVTLFILFVSREKKDPYLDVVQGLLLLLALSSTISWLMSIAPNDQGDYLYQKLIKEIVLALAITAVMTNRHRLHLLVLTIIISLGFLAVKEGAIVLLTAGGHKILGSGSIGDNNALATALLMAIPLMFYAARYSAVRIVRIGLMAVIGLSVVTIVMTFSRGGSIGLFLLGIFMVRWSRNKVGIFLFVVTAGVLVYALAPGSWFDRLDTIRDATSDLSFMGRVVAWKMSWLVAMDYPFFGGGPHAIQRPIVWEAYLPYLPKLDFIATPPPSLVPHAAHSIYFEVLGDLGFVGLFLFLGVIGVAMSHCRWIDKRARHLPGLVWAADLARMTQISIVIYLTTGAALSMGYFELLYILLALVSRCRRIVDTALAAEQGVPAQMASPDEVYGPALVTR